MSRLNDRAYKILLEEIQKITSSNSKAAKKKRNKLCQRLEKLSLEPGKPLNEEELFNLIQDIFPNFEREIVRAAAAKNTWGFRQLIAPLSITLSSSMVVILAVNFLPFPLIRQPVAEVAPILLLPKFWQMNLHYQKANTKLLEAQTLLEKANNSGDIALAEKKIQQAQKNLSAITDKPQWPTKFTVKQLQYSRNNLSHIEAKLWQEKNAFAQLEDAKRIQDKAKKNFQTASSFEEKKQALMQWQKALQLLQQLPIYTKAGLLAKDNLQNEKQEFTKVAIILQQSDRTQVIINAAEKIALNASQTCNSKAHTLDKWQECEKLWQKAIERLTSVTPKDPDYLQVQKLLATYQTNLGEIQIRLQKEDDAVKALLEAQTKINQLLKVNFTDTSIQERKQVLSDLQTSIAYLKTVQPGTTVYDKAQALLASARDKVQQLQ